MNRSGWRGYNFSRTIDGSMIPQRVQNLVIRNYCQSLNLKYLLSATEYAMPQSYMMLQSILGELESIEGIVMYSVHMLPSDPKVRNKVIESVLSKGAGLRFALEELTILDSKDISQIEELMVCKEMISQVKVEPRYLVQNKIENTDQGSATAFASESKFNAFNDEVVYSKESISKLSVADLEWLKTKASANPRKRMRICYHQGTNDLLHEMIIAHKADTYVRPHKHANKSESLYVIEGQADVIVFDDHGGIVDVIKMGTLQDGKVCYYRMQTAVFHTLLIKSDDFIFHETTNGPFIREQTLFPDWAPAEQDLIGQKKFMGELSQKLVSRK